MIEFIQVSKRYPGGFEALSEINFRLEQGEMLFLSGHSGAGKSTLLKCSKILFLLEFSLAVFSEILAISAESSDISDIFSGTSFTQSSEKSAFFFLNHLIIGIQNKGNVKFYHLFVIEVKDARPINITFYLDTIHIIC